MSGVRVILHIQRFLISAKGIKQFPSFTIKMGHFRWLLFHNVQPHQNYFKTSTQTWMVIQSLYLKLVTRDIEKNHHIAPHPIEVGKQHISYLFVVIIEIWGESFVTNFIKEKCHFDCKFAYSSGASFSVRIYRRKR